MKDRIEPSYTGKHYIFKKQDIFVIISPKYFLGIWNDVLAAQSEIRSTGVPSNFLGSPS